MNDLILENTLHINVRYIIEFVSYFIFAFTSSLLKEIYCTNTIQRYVFGPYKVICSTVIATIGTVAFQEYFNEYIEGMWGVSAFISIIFGLLGFEIFKHFTSISGIKSLIIKLKSVQEEVTDLKIEDNQIKKETRGKPVNLHKRRREDN